MARRQRLLGGLGLGLAGAIALSVTLGAAPSAPIADAARQGDRVAVKALLKQGLDVNAAQGDGTTALHWAAGKGDLELTHTLLYAGANVKASTRLGSYTPLYLAAKGGHSAVVSALLAAGANPKAVTSNGTTPLMMAAAAGDTASMTALIAKGADVNARDTAKGETALMFAAAFNRLEAVKLLLTHGADTAVTTKVVDLAALTAPEEETMRRQVAQAGPAGEATTPAPATPRSEPSSAGPQATGAAREANIRQVQQNAPAAQPAAPRPERRPEVAGLTRQFRYNELVGTQGGLTALQFGARQGYTDTVKALLDGGADINQVNPGDRTTPLLVTIINGHFDLVKELLERGAADPTLAADNGVTPLYAVLNVHWAPKSLYPGPKSYQQQNLTYLDVMKELLDKGADPNVRIRRKVWYQAYNSDFAGVDEIGATPFWRAAYASDIDAMRLLVAHGADPNIPSMRPAGRPRAGDTTREVKDVSGLPTIPVGGPGVPPLLAASGVGYGEGFAANAHRYAPSGFLPAIKYLVEELGADVNAVDHEGNTAIHHAASRGDTESILYLVSKGADPLKVNREGQTTVDMANGPVQRTQPYPETIEALMKLGAKNNNKCVTC